MIKRKGYANPKKEIGQNVFGLIHGARYAIKIQPIASKLKKRTMELNQPLFVFLWLRIRINFLLFYSL